MAKPSARSATNVVTSQTRKRRKSYARAKTSRSDSYIARIFNKIDKNKDGDISFHEFMQWHKPIIKKKFRKVDTDHNGSISFDEFRDWYIKSNI